MKNNIVVRKGPRFVVRQSGIHGRGVFARLPINEDDTVIEYKGEIISEDEIERRYPEDLEGLNHTFVFGVEHDYNIDGGSLGNAARWINHACQPNCESEVRNGRVFIRALRDIAPGEELNYDYGLVLEARHTPKVKADYACRCGSPACRGTMLAPKKRQR